MFSKKVVLRLNRTTKERNNHPSIFKGLILAMLSGMAHSFVGLIVKHIKNLHPGQLALCRFIATFAMCMPETVKTRQNLLGPRKLRILVVLRGVFGGLNVFLNFIAFRHLGLGEASVIIFSAPVFVTILARIFLKEPCNIFQTITVILTIIGIMFSAKLPTRLSEVPIVYSSEKTYGLLAAIFSLFSISILQILTRKVRPVHPSILTFHYSWVGILEIAILTAIFGNFHLQQCGIQNIYILLLALLSYCTITLLVMAFQCEYAGPVSTVRAAADISLSFLWQIFIFHDLPDTYGIIGAVLVLFSINLIGLDRWNASTQGNLLSCEKLKRVSF
ncbi:unnamed protein product [Larinioides sclopetarius]|uniref:EamA domain-containing protein n=1 Tax=Larinioides sclopetarius TaxID=280406 RepID=A0AAV2AQU0_9ARAC